MEPKSSADVGLEQVKRLRRERADDVVREQIRVILGPQPYRHNHYTDDDFFLPNAETGEIQTVYGQRVIRVTEDFVVGLATGLEEEVGPAAGELMYRIGVEWGRRDIKAFSKRMRAEFEAAVQKMTMGFVLETWWWPLVIEGWGNWQYDFRQSKQGLLFVDLWESAVAQSLGNIGKVVCFFYAGLFASTFSTLASKELAGVEVQCYSMGADNCRFLIASPKRVDAAAFWRNEGATTKDILKKIADV